MNLDKLPIYGSKNQPLFTWSRHYSPELAGQDDIIIKAETAIERCRNGLSFRGLIFVGLRGVGKTVLLTKIAQEAESKNTHVISLEVPERRSLPALIIPALRSTLLRIDRLSATGNLAKKALRTLGGFLKAMKIKYEYVEFSLDLGEELGVADSGDGVEFHKDALEHILEQTKGYPYFIQEWGKHCWEVSHDSPIKLEDAKLATQIAISELDVSFFRVRFDRLTPVEKKYLRAMAQLGPGVHRSGDIAQLIKKEVQSVAPTRASLIKKGMIYSPSHGGNAFTVPLFDEFMKRVMPGLDSV